MDCWCAGDCGSAEAFLVVLKWSHTLLLLLHGCFVNVIYRILNSSEAISARLAELNISSDSLHMKYL
jgi:hypothetical protein